MPLYDLMECEFPFRGAILQYRADCILVTHTYDTLGNVLLHLLPFVLHVLVLPLAFILSQDQTLHSSFFYPQSPSPESNFNQKRLRDPRSFCIPILLLDINNLQPTLQDSHPFPSTRNASLFLPSFIISTLLGSK